MHFNVLVSSVDHSIQCLGCSGERHLSCVFPDQMEHGSEYIVEDLIAMGRPICKMSSLCHVGQRREETEELCKLLSPQNNHLIHVFMRTGKIPCWCFAVKRKECLLLGL